MIILYYPHPFSSYSDYSWADFAKLQKHLLLFLPLFLILLLLLLLLLSIFSKKLFESTSSFFSSYASISILKAPAPTTLVFQKFPEFSLFSRECNCKIFRRWILQRTWCPHSTHWSGATVQYLCIPDLSQFSWSEPYILKVQKSAESAFQSQKICGKNA